MMSVTNSDNLQGLLANLNIDISSSYNNDIKVEKLVLQLGELSARYSDLAARYLKLASSKMNESTRPFVHTLESNHSATSNIQKSFLDILSVRFFELIYI